MGGAGDPGDITKPSKYGLKLKLNHVYPENRSQNYTPTWKILWSMLPLILRYIVYYIKHKILGKSIVMDYIKVQRAKQIYGVPLGGIGAGTIGRGYKGEFCRFQLRPGLYEYATVDANQFIVTIKDEHQKTIFHSLLSSFKKSSLSAWESLIEPVNCQYTGLYPRAWTEFDLSQYGINLICRQISPVIPNDYHDSSLPSAVFVWEVQNTSDKERTVTIAFTFKNGIGNHKLDTASTSSSKAFSYTNSKGVILYHTIDKTPCAYALSIRKNPAVSISDCLYFDPNSDGSEPWFQLKNNGAFENQSDKYRNQQIFGEMGVGIAGKTTIAPQNSQEVVMNLIWDMPTVTFPGKQKKYRKYYTQYFGTDNILKIVEYSFNNYTIWEQSIYDWQQPVLTGTSPDWFKGALFNESYYLSDGGSIWVALDEDEANKLPPSDIRRTRGRFAYLEGHEYKMYNTYDVHYYASFALFKNFPDLELSLQYDIRDSIFVEIPEKVKTLYDGDVVERKKPNTVPHDIGDPGEEPFLLPNSYPIHDVSNWRDLNPKFVLQVFRDAFMSTHGLNLKFLEDMYNACYIVMEKTLAFDEDDDGLIENSGYPDQTFDTWLMSGSSAYCGGIWLSALFAMVKITEALNKTDDNQRFSKLLQKAKVAFDKKLWNGYYYNFDCSEKECRSIMADQLCGHWYLRASGFTYETLPQEKVQKSLRTIYGNNVLKFCNGEMGAVNGFIDGDVDQFTIQSQEVWTGVTYALASHLIYEGMVDEGFKTAEGMYKSMTEKFGLAFDTPEALYAEKYYRAIAYMRPLSIWAMQLALEQQQNK